MFRSFDQAHHHECKLFAVSSNCQQPSVRFPNWHVSGCRVDWGTSLCGACKRSLAFLMFFWLFAVLVQRTDVSQEKDATACIIDFYLSLSFIILRRYYHFFFLLERRTWYFQGKRSWLPPSASDCCFAQLALTIQSLQQQNYFLTRHFLESVQK